MVVKTIPLSAVKTVLIVVNQAKIKRYAVSGRGYARLNS